eukprot:CAMPEP_0194486528 /NCGR_PEP_ID=MMETSP0253-20130528/7139_1 /TAXON_ID=2966 /ORGANISM="Noctiluca scintillans" /LENGTH=175 /DNA_ID=CAMNT_0039326623 /DNA_START=42 /DNA_END=569 /DNA_ORIENTATION=+
MPCGLVRGACRIAARRALAPRCGAAFVRNFGAHGDPRAHLNPDGTRPELEDGENYHDPDPLDHVPAQNLVKERGQTWVIGEPPKGPAELFGCAQEHVPFYPRQRLLIFGNHKLLMKAEYLFFYIPTVIVLGLCIPAFTTIYAVDELVATTMTVKVTGRQWYWVYEVESPTDDDDE